MAIFNSYVKLPEGIIVYGRWCLWFLGIVYVYDCLWLFIYTKLGLNLLNLLPQKRKENGGSTIYI